MRDPQNRSPSWYCSKCGAEQYESDPEYIEDGRSYCEDCFRESIMCRRRERRRDIWRTSESSV